MTSYYTKNFEIKLIEESIYIETDLSTDCSITLLYKPDRGSTEINKYEDRFKITDEEIARSNNKELVERIRITHAQSVFERFYRENFLNQ